MALIICPECGKEVSNQSDKCVHCGYPIHINKTKQENRSFGLNSTNCPFFSNKDKADKMQIMIYCIGVPLLILGLILKGTISYVMFGLVIIISICLNPTNSYIEVFSEYINGRTRSGKKFTIKINEITNVALGGEQITIYSSSTDYSVNCGNDGENIVAFINSVKKSQ